MASCWGRGRAGDAPNFLILRVQRESTQFLPRTLSCPSPFPRTSREVAEVSGLELPVELPIPASTEGGGRTPVGLSQRPPRPFLSPGLGDNRQDVYPPPAHMLFAVMTVISGANAAFSPRQSIRLITAWEAGLFKFKW